MSSFTLPPIYDNPDGGWGPSTSTNFPEEFKFKDIPYAPFAKSDKLGRVADWNDLSTDNRQSAAQAQNARQGAQGRRRDGNQAFGSGTASAFAYFHVEDESSFSLVDNKATVPRRGTGFNRGRGGARGGSAWGARGGAAGTGRGGRTGPGGGRGMGQRTVQSGRRGWRDWEKVRIYGNILERMKSNLNPRTTDRVKPPLLSLLHGKFWRRSSSTGCPSFAWKSTNLRSCKDIVHCSREVG
jgi:translation initiation factor 3 subunit D